MTVNIGQTAKDFNVNLVVSTSSSVQWVSGTITYSSPISIASTGMKTVDFHNAVGTGGACPSALTISTTTTFTVGNSVGVGDTSVISKTAAAFTFSMAPTAVDGTTYTIQFTNLKYYTSCDGVGVSSPDQSVTVTAVYLPVGLSIIPITWDVIGLDSNSPDKELENGLPCPNQFLVGMCTQVIDADVQVVVCATMVACPLPTSSLTSPSPAP